MMITRLFLLALLTTPLSLMAQRDDDHHHRNYFRGGYHLSDLVGDENYTQRSGWYAGYHHTLIKAAFLGVSMGLEYNTAGGQIDPLEVRLSYLGLPINGRVKVGLLYFDAGLGMSYKLGDKVLLDGNELDAGEAEDWDVLLHGGVGIKLKVIAFEARYRYGMIQPFDGYHNTGIQVGLALHL